jgi:hypothetical protein
MIPLRTAWKASLVLVVLTAAVMLTSRYWTAQIARSLICAEDVTPSDAMLIENFDPNYLLFERAEMLERAGLTRVALVPVEVSSRPSIANAVSQGIAEVMARHARLRAWRTLPIELTEPITFNAALQIRPLLAAEEIKSIIVIVPGFRSRRSSLVYRTLFGEAGVTVHCVPVFGRTTPEHWTHTWHGLQEVLEEFAKLQYYRFYVFPVRIRHAGQN